MRTTGSKTSLAQARRSPDPLSIGGVFAGLGGLDHGLALGGAGVPVWQCEVWEPARAVLAERFPAASLSDDILSLEALPSVDWLAAGFPCTDLSQAGSRKGLAGRGSGLILRLLDLIATSPAKPAWLIVENVPNMLVLNKGSAIALIVDRLERLGYKWAYRTVDARFTGLPQRRLRVLLVASLTGNPADALLAEDSGPPDESTYYRRDVFGFYWTEGRGGLGWARDAVPTLKGGSTVGIASPPAVWAPGNDRGERLATLSIADGERLQGFTPGWTDPSILEGSPDHRWKLIGNAVPVPVATWLGEQIRRPKGYMPSDQDRPLSEGARWPSAAWFDGRRRWSSEASSWPRRMPYRHLYDFIDWNESSPLSYRASLGFLRRLDESKLDVDPAFEAAVEDHVRAMRHRFTGNGGSAGSGSWASSPEARRRMQANKSKDTKPERLLRSELHRRGLRYRVHARPNPEIRNRVDIVFRPARVAVDVRGCFWHRCPCRNGLPTANAERWEAKLERNVQRDAELVKRLEAAGWEVVVVWEHDDYEQRADDIAKLVCSRRASR